MRNCISIPPLLQPHPHSSHVRKDSARTGAAGCFGHLRGILAFGALCASSAKGPKRSKEPTSSSGAQALLARSARILVFAWLPTWHERLTCWEPDKKWT